MGAEAKCVVTVGRKKAEGKALLETDALIFRGGDVRLAIPYKDVRSVTAIDGVLRVASRQVTASFALGVAAAKWAARIRNPPSRADKLGVKAGQVVLLVGVDDGVLAEELTQQGATVVTRSTRPVDVIFYLVSERSALTKLSSLREKLHSHGALWTLRPKGSADISEGEVMAAGKAAGFVDVKVVRFSETHTAEKFVIPVSKR